MGLTGLDNKESTREIIAAQAAKEQELDDVPVHKRAFRLQDLKPQFKLEKKRNEKAFNNQIAKIESEIKEKELDREFSKAYEDLLEQNEERNQKNLPVPFIQQNELDVFNETFYKVKYHSAAVQKQVI